MACCGVPGAPTPSALALWSRSAAVWAVVVPRSVLVLEGLDHRGPGFRRGNRVSARSMSFSGRNCAETRFVHRKRPRSRRWAPPLKVRGAHSNAPCSGRPRADPARPEPPAKPVSSVSDRRPGNRPNAPSEQPRLLGSPRQPVPTASGPPGWPRADLGDHAAVTPDRQSTNGARAQPEAYRRAKVAGRRWPTGDVTRQTRSMGASSGI